MTSEQKSEQQIPKGSIVVLDGVKTFQLGWSDCTDSPIPEAFITLVNKECELYVPEVVLHPIPPLEVLQSLQRFPTSLQKWHQLSFLQDPTTKALK